MTEPLSPVSLRRSWLTIALLAGALLVFQVLLTRVCALRLHFHFGFLIISNSLLGIGASGSLLALFDRKWRQDPQQWIWGFSLAFVLSLPLTWFYLLTAQIPETLKFETWAETLQFSAFNLACAVPFFFGGTAIGLLLSANAARVHSVYAADLVGAGLGCLLCPLLLWPVGAGGCFLATFLLALAAALSAAGPAVSVATKACLSVFVVFASMWMPRLDQDLPVPGKRWLDLTQAHTLKEFGRPVYTQWSANSRVDVIPLPPHFPRFLQARGQKALAMPLPQQWWIGQDGDAGTMLTDFGREPDKLDVLKYTMYSSAFHLKQGSQPKVCVIGVGGAPDLWAAKIHDASLIKGIELNRSIRELHDGVARDFSAPLFADPRVQVVVDEGRSSLMRDPEHYDVIQLTGIDTWTALNSGAYVLAENYLYTVDACRTMYDRLADGGVLQITRMAADMESIRLLQNMHAALPAAAQATFADSVISLATPVDNLCAVMLKKGAFTAEEVAKAEAWADEAQIQKRYLPGRELKNGIEEFVRTPDKAKFTADYPYDIRPTTDDWPYFFSFLRWDRPDVAKQRQYEPTWVVQGNPLFLWNQLLYSAIAAVVLILLPMLFRRGAETRSRAGALPFLVYFAGLGVGFIGIEIALIQKFTLLLGQPLYSIVVTLFAILVFTGVGSMLAGRVLRPGASAARYVPVAILLWMLFVAFASEAIVQACIALPLGLRAAVVILLVAPAALALGMPFAHGISIVQRINPSFVPWAWAVNGTTTVVGSILCVIVSMQFGFAAVLVGSAAIYLVAFAAIDATSRRAAA
jgi:spermidine synthase